MNVRERVLEFRALAEREAKLHSSSGTGMEERSSEELEALRSAYHRVYGHRDAVGQMPPSPETARAKLGGFLIRIVQHAVLVHSLSRAVPQ